MGLKNFLSEKFEGANFDGLREYVGDNFPNADVVNVKDGVYLIMKSDAESIDVEMIKYVAREDYNIMLLVSSNERKKMEADIVRNGKKHKKVSQSLGIIDKAVKVKDLVLKNDGKEIIVSYKDKKTDISEYESEYYYMYIYNIIQSGAGALLIDLGIKRNDYYKNV